MRVLRALTLAYVVVLVLALAASLIAILVSLVRIDRVLKDVAAALTTVRDRTAPLSGPLELAEQVTDRTAAALTEVRDRLARFDDQLGALAERLGVTGAAAQASGRGRR